MRLLTLFSGIAIAAAYASGAGLDGEQVYRSNCTRCHITIHTYPEKMSRSIVRHMRIKAQLTKAEADAVLGYLADSYDGAKKTRRASR